MKLYSTLHLNTILSFVSLFQLIQLGLKALTGCHKLIKKIIFVVLAKGFLFSALPEKNQNTNKKNNQKNPQKDPKCKKRKKKERKKEEK